MADSRISQLLTKQQQNASAFLSEALAQTRKEFVRNTIEKKYQKEIDRYQKHLEDAKKCGDILSMNRAYKNMGNAYNSIGEYKKAIECSCEQLKIAEKLKNKEEIAVAYGIMAFGYNGKRQYKESIDCCRKQLELVKELEYKKTEISTIYLNIGITYIDWGQLHEAINPICIYLETSKESGSRKEIQHVYAIMGIVYTSIGQFKKAINCHQIQLEIADENKDMTQMKMAFLYMSIAYEWSSQFKEAITYYRKLLEIAYMLGDRREMGSAHALIGIFYRKIGQYKEAIDNFQNQWQISNELGDKMEMALAHEGMGLAYSAIGQDKDAISSYRQHMEIAKNLENVKEIILAENNIQYMEKSIDEIDSHRKNREVAKKLEDVGRVLQANESLGAAYTKFGRYREAIECHRQHLEIAQIIEDKKKMGIAYRGMAVAYKGISRYKETIDYCCKQLEIAEESGDKKETEVAYTNMTFAYNKIGQYNKAIECCHKLLKIAETKAQGKEEMERVNEMMSVVRTAFGQPKQAINCCHTLLENAEELGDKICMERAYKIMGVAYSTIGQYEKAIDYHWRHLKVAKELGNNKEMELACRNVAVLEYRIGLSNEAIYHYLKRKKECLEYLGRLYKESGRHEKASNCYKKAKISNEIEDIYKRNRRYINMEMIKTLPYKLVICYVKVMMKSLLKRNANTVEEKIQSGTEALGGPAGGLGESKDEGIAFVKPSPNTNEIEEGSQSASGDSAGLGESENERVASVEPSPNRSGFCEENSKNTVEEKIQSGTEDFGGPAGGHGESKDEGIASVKPSPNTNEIEESSQSASRNPVGLGESDNERVASVEPSPNRNGFSEENSKNTVEEKVQSETEALGGPVGGHGESKDEGIAFLKPSPNTNETEELKSQLETTALGDPVDKSGDKRIASIKITKTSFSSSSSYDAVADGEADQAGLKKENEVFKKHGENVEARLTKIVNVDKKSTLTANLALVDSTASKSCKNENGAETEPTKDDTQSINGQQQETEEELNNPPHISFVRKRRRTKRKSLISPELRESLKRIPYVKGFGVLGKRLTIHVLEDHEEETEPKITKALEKHPFDGEWRTEIFHNTDSIKLYSDSAGGHSLYRKFSRLLTDAVNPDGTIGCFIKFENGDSDGDSAYNGKMYAVTCKHVVQPENNNAFISFFTRNDQELELKEFSTTIKLFDVDRNVPMDIALLPVEESCDAFNFERDEYCEVYDDEISKLSHENVNVQKQGAISGLTHGEILELDGSYEIAINNKEEWYDHVIVVKSSVPDKTFSEKGDSGSLVTLTRNNGDDEIHNGKALSMVFAGTENDEEEKMMKLTYTFPFVDAIEILLERNQIENDYVILSKFMSTARGIEENRNERVASDLDPISPNRNIFPGVYGHDIDPGKNDAQANNEDQPGANTQLNNFLKNVTR